VSGPPFDTFLSVGGVTFRVVSDDPRLASRPGGSLAAFASDCGSADVEMRASWIETLPERPGRVLFDSGGAWQLLQSDADLLFLFRSSVGGGSPYKIARFNPAFTSGDVHLYRRHFDDHPSSIAHPLQYPLDELLMIHVLSLGKGVEVHGCGLLDAAGRAYLFAGQSGAGKSTMARLWIDQPGTTLLSDERIVLRTDGDRVVAYGTPWQGDAHFASPRCGELAAIFFLGHAPVHLVAPTAAARAAAQLFSCSFLPFHSADAVGRTMAAVDRVTQATACYDLRFAPDRSVVDVLARHMS
jgi:hypothetical protein